MAVLIIVAGFAGTPGEAAEQKEYVPYSNIEQGTDGVNAVPIEIRNDAKLPIRCTASLAHWYSARMGEVAPGKTLSLTVWHNPQTGELSLMNDLQDRMPVEAIWCNQPPHDFETRSSLPLEFRSGESPSAIRRICATADKNRLECREVGNGDKH